MKVVSFDRSSLKKEAQRFSANSACPPILWESFKVFQRLLVLWLAIRQAIGNVQHVQLQLWLCFYIMHRLAKARWTNLESAPKDRVNLFLNHLLTFSIGRGAMNAPRLWNLRKGISLARAQRCLLRLFSNSQRWNMELSALCGYPPLGSEFLPDILVVFQIGKQRTRRRWETF